VKVYNLTVIIERDEDRNFLAICPALQGCYTDGATLDEALEMIEDAIKLHIESRLENGETIPEEIYSSQLKIAV
jgi:predicted RNase H-like HicB family nuclease